MTNPRNIDWLALRRIARYLAGKPRMVYRFAWQASGELTTYVDTDFGGCLETRRSTSGGCILYGTHLVRHWSTTQKVLALSSGEAELYGVVKGASEALGLQSFAADLGITAAIIIKTDSSAAIGICSRAGIGRVRHLATGQLWVQERLRAGAFRLFKHPGEANPSDICTKHVPSELLVRHLPTIGSYVELGRPDCAPMVTEKRGLQMLVMAHGRDGLVGDPVAVTHSPRVAGSAKGISEVTSPWLGTPRPPVKCTTA